MKKTKKTEEGKVEEQVQNKEEQCECGDCKCDPSKGSGQAGECTCEGECKCDKGSKEKAHSPSSGQACDCEGEKEELKNQVKRVLADYQNLEKRVAEQRSEWARSASKEVLLKMLPILDTLILAKKHDKNETLQIVFQQFVEVLQKEGLQKIKTVGEDFDPNTMEGIGKQEGEEGKVLEEVREGFILYDRVLRPAQVIVGGGLHN